MSNSNPYKALIQKTGSGFTLPKEEKRTETIFLQPKVNQKYEGRFIPYIHNNSYKTTHSIRLHQQSNNEKHESNAFVCSGAECPHCLVGDRGRIVTYANFRLSTSNDHSVNLDKTYLVKVPYTLSLAIQRAIESQPTLRPFDIFNGPSVTIMLTEKEIPIEGTYQKQKVSTYERSQVSIYTRPLDETVQAIAPSAELTRNFLIENAIDMDLVLPGKFRQVNDAEKMRIRNKYSIAISRKAIVTEEMLRSFVPEINEHASLGVENRVNFADELSLLKEPDLESLPLSINTNSSGKKLIIEESFNDEYGIYQEEDSYSESEYIDNNYSTFVDGNSKEVEAEQVPIDDTASFLDNF